MIHKQHTITEAFIRLNNDEKPSLCLADLNDYYSFYRRDHRVILLVSSVVNENQIKEV